MENLRKEKVMRNRVLAAGLAVLLLLVACGDTNGEDPETGEATGEDSDAGVAGEEADSAEAEPTVEGSTQGGTLTVAISVNPSNLETNLIGDTIGRTILNNVADRLIRDTEDGGLEPLLAESWDPIDDTTWEVKLREGVEFHNGEPFTGEAVKYTIERLVDPEYDNFRPGRWAIFESVDVIDDYTVHINTVEPSGLVPVLLSWAPIMPPAYSEEVGQEGYSQAPIGTGPFEFVEWIADDRIVLRANENYWQGRPALDEVIFRVIPEPSTRIAELRTGGVDIIAGIPPAQVDAVDQEDGVSVVTLPSNRFLFVSINMTNNPALADVRVRQALNYAVDIDAIVENIFEGEARAMSQPIHDLHIFHSETVDPYPHDPDRARELLAEAGHESLSLTFGASVNRYINDSEVVQALVHQWGEAGIDVDLELREWAELSAIQNSPVDEIEYDLMLAAWGTGRDADQTYSPRLLSGSPGIFYDNPEADALIRQGATQLDDESRQTTYDELAQLTHEDAPWVFLYAQNDSYGINDRVSGFTPAPDEFMWFYDTTVEE